MAGYDRLFGFNTTRQRTLELFQTGLTVSRMTVQPKSTGRLPPTWKVVFTCKGTFSEAEYTCLIEYKSVDREIGGRSPLEGGTCWCKSSHSDQISLWWS